MPGKLRRMQLPVFNGGFAIWEGKNARWEIEAFPIKCTCAHSLHQHIDREPSITTMKQVILTTALIIAALAVIAQPTTADIDYRSLDHMTISVVECQSGCDVEPGIYQLADNGYSKVADLESVGPNSPASVMAANSKKVLDVLSLVGVGQLRVRFYEEFWISDCAKQSVYTLAEDQELWEMTSSRP